MMTVLYLTDKEQRAINPAGMRCSCGATIAWWLVAPPGDESWVCLRANFTYRNYADGQFNLLNLKGAIWQGEVVVDKLKHL